MLFKGYFSMLYSDTSLEFPVLHSNKEKKKKDIVHACEICSVDKVSYSKQNRCSLGNYI